MPIRTVVWFDYTQVEEAQRLHKQTNMITMGGVKVIQDGSIQVYTGYLSEPYYLPFRDDVNYCGYPTRSREELTDLVKKTHNAGYQLNIHGNGDAAIDDILYAISDAQKNFYGY